MCAEKDNEEHIEALVKAARAAFLSLKETRLNLSSALLSEYLETCE